MSELRTAMADPRRANVTHSETERMDLLDGVVLELCRSARRAACAAAAALGQPAIAEDFELSALYGPRSSGGTPPAPSEPKA